MQRDTRTVFSMLEKLRGGMLDVRLPDGANTVFGDGVPGVTLHVHDEAMFGRVLARGDIGLAEAYLDGLWDAPDLTGFLTLLARNRDSMQKAVYGAWHKLLAARIRHYLNHNSKAGSQRNIMAHYDLGNDFYRLWLDPGMSYSAAIFNPGNDSLETAQSAKYQRILDQLQAAPGERVLEIGCGWGGFAELAERAGLHVTGLTLSPAQLEWAQRRVASADLRLQDYRDLDERFDHVVSIEMFEAVGERWWPVFFSRMRELLARGGRAAVQTITIRDERFEGYRDNPDFIQRYIFPGGMLPSPERFKAVAASSGLSCGEPVFFGASYARTLEQWMERFEAALPDVRALGFDERFVRMWRYYLAYCRVGFESGNCDVMQVSLEP
jgi:cyclopropane-fatty-acyl-phospholipid synthase